jgi:iron(III) transport system substrate-binding protein
MNFPNHTRGALRAPIIALGALAASLVGSLTLVSASAHAASNPGFVLYSAQGYDSAAVKAFNATHPGFTVTLNDNSTGPLLQQIQAEGGNPKWGVLWVDGATAFAQLDREKLLVKKSVPKVKFNALGKANVPKDGSFTPTGLTVTGALCYDSQQISASQLPTTWQDLTKPEFKNIVGMNDPSQSGPTYPLIAGLMANLGGYSSGSTASSVAAGKSFFTQLAANGLIVNSTNGVTLGAMQAQSISMALVQSSACYGDILNGSFPTLKLKYLDMSVALPSVIGIDSKQPKVVRADAQKFVNWVMSRAGQHVMQTGDPQGDSLFWPVLTGEKPANAIIPPLSSTHAITINPYIWGPLETQINTWFDSNIANG